MSEVFFRMLKNKIFSNVKKLKRRYKIKAVFYSLACNAWI